MADVRSLLKAKRQEARISHPYATYTPSDQLKCLICASIVKHASAWEGHLGSKAHRTNLARLKQEEQAVAQREHEANRQVPSKRKAEDTSSPSRERDSGKTKKAKLAGQTPAASSSSGFPNDFFSDPNRQLPALEPEDEEEEGEEEGDAMVVDKAGPSASSAAHKTAVDEEYEAFQKAMMTSQVNDAADKFAQATVSGEAEIFTEEQISGFKPQDETGSAEGDDEKTEQQKAEEKKRARELEDRELIMDRLLEEERLQEEADMRVAAMKSRMEALKKKREARKAEKTQVT
ncbi:hypothetical protein FA15DRAFT_91425 [Coprinopsis marcescibilis]|uniref:Uncharacterized protein n=1 Tax=Coprinopsis marcescibilis TaxID=230819 RepID=A0A5C3L5C5_COPMA|nr:hypothetical protein FA15DRAFT_91425 [Coprinopsis marcescibilis]